MKNYWHFDMLIWGCFHGTCDTFTSTFTKSFETFRACVIINSKTCLLLEKIDTTFYWRAVVKIPDGPGDDLFWHFLACNTCSFAILGATEILIIDSDSASPGLSEFIIFIIFFDVSEGKKVSGNLFDSPVLSCQKPCYRRTLNIVTYHIRETNNRSIETYVRRRGGARFPWDRTCTETNVGFWQGVSKADFPWNLFSILFAYQLIEEFELITNMCSSFFLKALFGSQNPK